MKLYHVSLDTNITEEFTPFIPDEEIRIASEDGETPRICLAKTIRGCLTAVVWGGADFEEMFFDNGVSQLIRVYEFDRKDIAKGNLVSSKKLYQSDKVRDAEISGEVWVINQNLKPRKTYLIQVTDFEEGCEDDVSYEDLKSLKDDEDYGDIINGCFTTINFIKYDTLNDDSYESKLTLNFKVKRSQEDSEDTIKEKVERFILEHWEVWSLNVSFCEEDDTYLIKGEVDFSNRPISIGNFFKLLKDEMNLV